jgi:hypothetical protein
MKHGDQAKAQSAKAKASGNQGAVEVAETSKRGSGKTAADAKSTGKSGKAGEGSGKDSSSGRPAARAGKGRPAVEEAVAFHNPAVGSALERAIETYPNAFRRLSD